MENILVTPTINKSGLEAKALLDKSKISFSQIFDKNEDKPILMHSESNYPLKGINEIKKYIESFQYQ